MADREVRISQDGDSVAVRSDNAPDAWNAWAVMNAVNGGYWAKEEQVADWDVVTEVEAATPVAPENPPVEPDPAPEPE